MARTRPEPPELPTPITPDPDEFMLTPLDEDGLVPPAGIDDDPESVRVANLPD